MPWYHYVRMPYGICSWGQNLLVKNITAPHGYNISTLITSRSTIYLGYLGRCCGLGFHPCQHQPPPPLPPKESGEEGLPQGHIYWYHQAPNLGESPLQALEIELKWHPQSGVGRLGMLQGKFNKNTNYLGICLDLRPGSHSHLLSGTHIGPQTPTTHNLPQLQTLGLKGPLQCCLLDRYIHNE